MDASLVRWVLRRGRLHDKRSGSQRSPFEVTFVRRGLEYPIDRRAHSEGPEEKTDRRGFTLSVSALRSEIQTPAIN